MHWSTIWIGLPYAALGRGPQAYDCLGLFLAVQADQFGRALPYGLVAKGAGEIDAQKRHIADWHRVDVAREGDAVLMRRGRGWHIGVALDDRMMLHADRPASLIEDYRCGRWGTRLDGVYRFAD